MMRENNNKAPLHNIRETGATTHSTIMSSPSKHPQQQRTVKQMASELRDLESEKKRIEAALRLLRARKVQNMIHDYNGESEEEDDDESTFDHDDDSQTSSSPQQYESDVSSLYSSQAYEASDHYNDDDESIMTENVYHYDVRGRRLKDDDYYYCGMEETGTVLACYENQQGGSNTPTSKPNNKKKSQAPMVVIEWSRGKTYVPKANRTEDGIVYGQHHPTEISLLVADDNSFYDELSFSSGDDSQLAAAVTDMPMEIDFLERNDNDDDNNDNDDASLTSELHSDWDACSISIVEGQPTKDQRRHKDIPRLIVPNPQTQTQTQTQTQNLLYNQRRSKDASYQEASSSTWMQDDTIHAVVVGSDISGQQIPLLIGDGNGNGDDDDASKQKQKQQDSSELLPNEISCSEMSLESLGSELCGVSINHQQQEQQQQQQQQTKEQSSTVVAVVQKPPTSSTTNHKKDKKIGPNNHKRNKTATGNMLGGPDSESELAQELSAKELDAIQKREQKIIKMDSGDERPLRNISKRKKRRSFDATSGPLVVVAAAAARSGKKTPSKRTKNSASSNKVVEKTKTSSASKPLAPKK